MTLTVLMQLTDTNLNYFIEPNEHKVVQHILPLERLMLVSLGCLYSVITKNTAIIEMFEMRGHLSIMKT